MKKLFFLLLATILLGSCTGNPKTENSKSDEKTQTATVKYPPLPDDIKLELWNKCDYIDFIFYNYSFAMNQSDQQNIRLSLQHINPVAPKIDPNCQPIGRIFYQIEGENAAEADLVMGEGCNYLVFYRDGEKSFANELNEAGQAFFNRVFNMMEKNSQQQPGSN